MTKQERTFLEMLIDLYSELDLISQHSILNLRDYVNLLLVKKRLELEFGKKDALWHYEFYEIRDKLTEQGKSSIP